MILNRKKIFITVTIILLFGFLSSFNFNNYVFADSLSDSIGEQLTKIDLSALESFFNGLNDFSYNSFISTVENLLKGKYDSDYNSITAYLLGIVFDDLFELLPTFLSVIAIAILCGIVNNAKSSYMSESVGEITLFACLASVVILLLSEFISIYDTVENIIKNIANLSEIMSPIIITLMVAVGGNVSASVYKPAVTFLSGGVINLILYAVLPLILMMTVFYVVSGFSGSIKLNKFAEFAQSTIKWILGIVITVFSFFLTVQGITGARYDGISFKAAKYAISNSVPIIGGFLKDGFDLVVAGSVLIKNAIGVAIVFGLFFIVLAPILRFAVFSILLKLTAALIEPICDVRISNFCTQLEKSVTYLTVALLSVGFMFFILVILMTVSANAFI